MAPWLPRMHLFEIHDQPWFHPWFRAKVQAALTETWIMQLPLVQRLGSPASIVAKILADELGEGVSDYVFVDYCAGGGGPTPFIERYLNGPRAQAGSDGGNNDHNGNVENDIAASNANGGPHAGNAPDAVVDPNSSSKSKSKPPVHFVLTDLHPHIPNWSLAAAASPQIHYAPRAVDAAASPPDLLATVEPPLPVLPPSSPSPKTTTTKTFRTFHLAFHHLPTPLASSVLADTLATSSGFAIIELQDRHLRSFLAVCLLGLGVLAFAPYFAWRWRSPGTLFWCWVVPVLPFVLVWDGWMSSVRTRTVEEITDMMAGCGAGADVVKRWETRTGRVTHLPPFAEVNWIVATKREEV